MNERLLALATAQIDQKLARAVERWCSFNCDAESSCPCIAHKMYRDAVAAVRAGAALPPQKEAQDVIDACANYLERNYPEEGAEYVEALRHQAWGPILKSEVVAPPPPAVDLTLMKARLSQLQAAERSHDVWPNADVAALVGEIERHTSGARPREEGLSTCPHRFRYSFVRRAFVCPCGEVVSYAELRNLSPFKEKEVMRDAKRITISLRCETCERLLDQAASGQPATAPVLVRPSDGRVFCSTACEADDFLKRHRAAHAEPEAAV